MRNGFALLAAVAALTTMTACASSGTHAGEHKASGHKAGKHSLAGPEWIIFEIGGQPALTGVKATINFEDGRAFGAGSCNRYTGGYTSTGKSQIKFGPMASTMMACPDPMMEQEGRLLKILGDVTSYSIDADGVLTLKTADNRTVRARR